MKPTISICCLSYNHSTFLKKTIDSFLDQKGYFILEIIIFDDCSTDNSRDIIDHYAKEYPECFKLIYPDENIYSKGKTAYFDIISCATGEFLAFCEGDDYWVNELKLQKQLDYLRDNDTTNLVFHPALNLYTNGKISDKRYGFYGETVKHMFFEDVLIESGGFMPMASIFARRKVYIEWLNLYPSFFSESMWHSTIQILGAYKSKVGYLPEKMSVYRTMHEGSWSVSISRSSDAIINDYRSFIKRNRTLNEIMKYEYEYIFDQVLIKRAKKISKNKILNNQQKNNLLKDTPFEFGFSDRVKILAFKIISSAINYVR